jgi:hypothetical protein
VFQEIDQVKASQAWGEMKTFVEKAGIPFYTTPQGVDPGVCSSSARRVQVIICGECLEALTVFIGVSIDIVLDIMRTMRCPSSPAHEGGSPTLVEAIGVV